MHTDYYGFLALPTLLHPFSTGSVKLASKDPFQHPLIDPAYLKDERDMQVFYNGRFYIQCLAKRLIKNAGIS